MMRADHVLMWQCSTANWGRVTACMFLSIVFLYLVRGWFCPYLLTFGQLKSC